MKVYSYINTNADRIRRETKFGLVSTSVMRHWEIYSRYDIYKKMGHTVVESVLFTAGDMGVCERMVFNIIKKMESEI